MVHDYLLHGACILTSQDLVLRSCLIRSMEGAEAAPRLQKLELYDNQVEAISPRLGALQFLTVLDLSYNNIRDMGPVRACRGLQKLYVAQNKLREISGLEDMRDLRLLDLGANRIRVSNEGMLLMMMMMMMMMLMILTLLFVSISAVADHSLAYLR
jgi:Leucine-rich repeat (LRR) protein